jgi:serine/threonine protein kinase
MEKFKNLEKIAEGTFGIVYKANENEEVVAIKEMKAKYTNWEECKSLREVKSLINLKHENIVKLKELNLEKDTLYLVFEFMEKNLYDLMSVLIKKNRKFSEAQIKYIAYQTLNGIAYMHRYGFFHRDMKPENLLVKGESIKIADFGLAREIRSLPPYTDYVSTRWYRAPECLLKASNYNSPIDIWALGAIMAELYSLKPLFPGTSEKDQLFKICSIIGSPVNQWGEAINLAKKIEFKFPNVNGAGLKASCPEASPEAIEVMTEMLKWDPNKRATASKLLTFAFFSQVNINTKISMIINDSSNEGYYNNSSVYSNEQSSKKTITKQEDSDIDKSILKCLFI